MLMMRIRWGESIRVIDLRRDQPKFVFQSKTPSHDSFDLNKQAQDVETVIVGATQK